jgi:hypothetical protein
MQIMQPGWTRKMQGLLVRVGIDVVFGGWNAPVDPVTGRFVYVPIPEKGEPLPGLDRRYDEVTPALISFCSDCKVDLDRDLKFPQKLLDCSMHLDPDFEYLTYGDRSQRGSPIHNLQKGDFIIFYAGLKPITTTNISGNLYYAIIGYYQIDKILNARAIEHNNLNCNAHTRRMQKDDTDIIVFGQRDKSGRLKHCILIGEFRNKAYRVNKELLDAWGDISVKDGFIQRSGNLPFFNDPEKFLSWFFKHDITFLESNN